MNKMQSQQGYAAVITLILILGVISILGFVVEVGRMLEVTSRLSNGTNLAARGGAVQYGITITKKYEEEYKKLKPTIVEEVEDELGETASEAEMKKEVKKRVKEKLQAKIPEIKENAKQECKDKVALIIQTYKLVLEQYTCAQEKVSVMANVLYAPVIGEIAISSTTFRRQAIQEVYINTNE